MNFFTTSILTLVFFYILLLIVVFFFQRNLLYQPSVDNYLKDQVVREPAEIEKVKITTKDKIDLIGWFYNQDLEKFKTILFFHGNAGSLENRTYKLNHFKDLNVNFLIIAWRGFSGNKGKPNEIGLYEDAKATIKWLSTKGIKEKNIILYGESLGTGVAVEVAQSYKKITNISVPILIIHGKVDKIVPYDMGKKMYELANEPKFFYSQEYGDHMVDYDESLLLALKKFIQSLN